MDREGAKRRVVRALSFHADYRCQNTGVCCSSGWEIAIETPIELLLKQRLRTGTPALPNGADGFALMTDPPANCTSAFRLDDSGTCWFRDKERGDCALHRTLGQKSLASACRQFPPSCSSRTRPGLGQLVALLSDRRRTPVPRGNRVWACGGPSGVSVRLAD